MRIVALAAGLALMANSAFANDVYGVWKSEPNDEGGYIHVEIGACADDAAKVCGKILEAFSANPDAPPPEWLGKNIIEDMVADGSSAWEDGTIWAPDDDETYSSTMELNGDVLTVSGCVLGGLICRGQDWTRVQ
ncbi:MAG: DUF2147 domain-containing protein [Pseudomonadota bacterium]